MGVVEFRQLESALVKVSKQLPKSGSKKAKILELSFSGHHEMVMREPMVDEFFQIQHGDPYLLAFFKTKSGEKAKY